MACAPSARCSSGKKRGPSSRNRGDCAAGQYEQAKLPVESRAAPPGQQRQKKGQQKGEYRRFGAKQRMHRPLIFADRIIADDAELQQRDGQHRPAQPAGKRADEQAEQQGGRHIQTKRGQVDRQDAEIVEKERRLHDLAEHQGKGKLCKQRQAGVQSAGGGVPNEDNQHENPC